MFWAGAFLVAVFLATQSDDPPRPGREITRTAEQQGDRQRAIKDAIDADILMKVERTGTAVDAWTGRQFTNLPFDGKRGLAGLIYAYHFTHQTKGQRVRFRDGYTDKLVGHFTAEGGLTLE